MSDRGHVELERSIDSIVVGERHRREPGDLTPLTDSMKRVGLLQPVTITPEGFLICGYRRLEAAKRLLGADGGTLYRVTEDGEALRFAIVRTDSLGLRLGGVSEESPQFPDLPLRLP